MTNRIAVLQVADTGPLESLVDMLQVAGYDCLLPDERVKRMLREAGCDTVLDIDGLVRGMGYESPMVLGLAGPELMPDAHLYVDIKAHRNAPKVWGLWPSLKERTLWYRINGGEPENTERGGDEVNLICPILTPNPFYRDEPWKDKAYSVWPPFHRLGKFNTDARLYKTVYGPPICLIHNLKGWGYGSLIPGMKKLGVKLYGAGSPDGLISNTQANACLRTAKAMVHLKSNDCPGYAIYQALASGCPCIVTRRMIWRMRMEELLIPGETCMVFDRIGHQELSSEDIEECNKEVKDALEYLSLPENNRRIGIAGRVQLEKVMWKASEHGEEFTNFMRRLFP